MESARERIRRFCSSHAASVMWDDASETLLDVFSGKALALPTARVQHAIEKQAADTGETYLLLVLGDGRQLALAAAGIAFPPDPRNVGALPLPPVVCWRDFENVVGRVEHVLAAHPDEPPGRELLDMVRYGIALLDGARAIGFEVAREERRLERCLEAIEGSGDR